MPPQPWNDGANADTCSKTTQMHCVAKRCNQAALYPDFFQLPDPAVTPQQRGANDRSAGPEDSKDTIKQGKVSARPVPRRRRRRTGATGSR